MTASRRAFINYTLISYVSIKSKYLFSKPQDYTDFHEKTIIVLMF